jgi:hypothetical protein
VAEGPVGVGRIQCRTRQNVGETGVKGRGNASEREHTVKKVALVPLEYGSSMDLSVLRIDLRILKYVLKCTRDIVLRGT